MRGLGRVGRDSVVAFYTKPGCEHAQQLAHSLTQLIAKNSPETVVLAAGQTSRRKVDLAITVGGDGTLLHAASRFRRTSPVFLPISSGTLGFMLPFSKKGTTTTSE